MPESRGNFNRYYVPGLFAVAKDEYKRYPDIWKSYLSVRKSDKAYEESGYISGFGHMYQKPEGTAVKYDARLQGPVKRWVHDTWALGVRMTQEALEDCLYDIMTRAMKDLGKTSAATRHFLAARMLVMGDTTTYHTDGYGSAIFANNHVHLDGSTWSNLAAAAAPTETTLGAAIEDFEQIRNERNIPYIYQVKKVICGPSLEFRFTKLLESTYEPDTANNAVNAVIKRRRLELVIDPYITDDNWYLCGDMDTDIGMIWFDRIAPQVSRHGDADTGDVKFIVRGRWSLECNNPRQIFLVPHV